MLLGDYEAAWAASDEIDARAGSAASGQRFWDGAPLTGKRVMLRSLHGFGDALQFIRFAPLLRAQARSLCVEANPEIVPLLRACRGVEQVIGWGPLAPVEPPAWDSQVEIMELPRIVRATPDALPAPPYLDTAKLKPNAETLRIVAAMRERRSQSRPQIGFAWRSSNWNPLRSVPLASLAASVFTPLVCNFYSLQQNGEPELAAFPALHNIEADFENLALRMAHLDAVLTVDGVLAHLAGALNFPVLLLLPHAADWRWGLRETTPWYPRTRLFRQPSPGDWAPALAEAASALRHLISS